MTEEQREAWNAKKDEARAKITAERAGWESDFRPMLDGTDRRIWDYLAGVMGNMDAHNLYELLAVVRFFTLLSKYAWNAKRVRAFFRFYEALRFNGAHGRTRYKLTPVQCFQFGSIFGFMRPDGRRLVRLAYLFVPRKYGKTTSVASLAVHDLLFGDANAQAYVAANSYAQAKICFDEIRAIMRDLDPREKHFRVNREAIFFKDAGRDSLARCLSANPKTLDGLNASLVIMDEYAQARDTATKSGAALKNVLTSSMGARREPLTVVLTTASDVLDGPFRQELDGVMRVLRGEGEADTMFASIFMPDADDDEGDPKTWAKVQPHIGVTVQPDYYELEWQTAQLSAQAKLDFRTKLLNVFATNDTKTWLTSRQIAKLMGDVDIDGLTSRPSCAVAFDLSVHDDFSAVAYSWWNGKDKKFYCHVDYYFPRGSMADHPNRELYQRWVDDGWLKLCDGDRIDCKQIASDIIRRTKKLHIISISYDAYKAQELRNILANAGGPETLAPYSQTYGSFNLPVESFELLALADPPNIVIDRNPINAFCLGNCVIDIDKMDNKKPVKIEQSRKIDGVICILMTLGMLYTYKH